METNVNGICAAAASVALSLPLLSAPVLAQAADPGGIEVVKTFTPSRDKPITLNGVTADQGGWRIRAAATGPVRLFEVAGATCEACRLVFRAKVKTRDLAGPAFLEMWVRIPVQGEFFSRGLDQTVSGTVDWTSVEIPFFLQKGQRADLVKLNVSLQATGGSLWIRDIELLRAPLP
jgi:hypothetical protein